GLRNLNIVGGLRPNFSAQVLSPYAVTTAAAEPVDAVLVSDVLPAEAPAPANEHGRMTRLVAASLMGLATLGGVMMTAAPAEAKPSSGHSATHSTTSHTVHVTQSKGTSGKAA